MNLFYNSWQQLSACVRCCEICTWRCPGMKSERCCACRSTNDLALYEADESYGYGTKAALELALENQRIAEESNDELERRFCALHAAARWGRIARRLRWKHARGGER